MFIITTMYLVKFIFPRFSDCGVNPASVKKKLQIRRVSSARCSHAQSDNLLLTNACNYELIDHFLDTISPSVIDATYSKCN